MVKTSSNYTFYDTPSTDAIDVQQYAHNTTGNAVVFADNITPKEHNTFTFGEPSKRWNNIYSDTVYANTVAVSDTNYLLIPPFVYTYATDTTLNPLNPPLLFLPPLGIWSNIFDGGNTINDGNLIKFPSRGLYLLQFDLSWNTDTFVPTPSGMLDIKMINTIDGRSANDTMSDGFMFIAPTPIFSTPLFFNASMPIRFEIMWTCLNVNERIKMSLTSNESIFGRKLFTQPEDFALTFSQFSITRITTYA